MTAQDGPACAATARLLRFSGAGFTGELAAEASRVGDVPLLTSRLRAAVPKTPATLPSAPCLRV